MPKGEGSPRIVLQGADALEERMLLSHLAVSSTTVHALSSSATTQQVTVVSPVSKPDVDPTAHASATAASDVQEREAEDIAAAAQAGSSTSNDQFTYPLIFAKGKDSDADDTSNATAVISGSSRAFRVSYGDEHVAWSVGRPASVNLVTMSRNWTSARTEVPEIETEAAVDGKSLGLSEIKSEAGATHASLATQGADLLAPYLPVDRASLEQAIDRLIDGFETLGDRINGHGQEDELIPWPIAWGICLATVEIIRRRFRKRTATGGDDEPDADPALGIRGVT